MTHQNAGATPAPFSMRDLLKIRNYRSLWIGQSISNLGDALTHLALVLLINEVTAGSTTAIAYLLIALALPHATIGLMGGAMADRFDRRRTMIASDLLRAVLTAGFVIMSLAPDLNLPMLYTIAFFHAVVNTFFAPARAALIPSIVPEEGLLSANSLSQMSFVLFRVVGTSVAGILLGVLGAFEVVFAIDALTFVLSAVFIYRISGVATKAEPKTEESAIFAEIREGLAIILGNRILVGTLVGIGVTMLGVGALNVLLAPFIVNDLNISETWFGAIEFAQSSAMILSSLVVAALAARFKATNIITTSLLAIGLCSMSLMLVSNVWHLFPILFAVGLAMTPLNAAAVTLLQTLVADEARGRVSSALNAIIQVATLLSMFAAGAAAASIGLQNVFFLAGAITLFASVLAGLIFRGYTTPPQPTRAAQLEIG